MQDLAKAIATADADTLAELVSEMPRDRLRALLTGELRELAITELFRRLPEYVDADAAADLDGVVAWEVTAGQPGEAGAADRYLLRLSGGTCTVLAADPAGDSAGGEPTVTIRLDAADLLRLATGNGSVALLVLAGDLVLSGDEQFALRLVRSLRLPTAGGVVPLGDPSKVDAVAVARLIGTVGDRELRQRLRGGVRQLLVEEIFERMPDYFRPEAADGVDAVIAWRITGREDGTDDRFLLRVAGGTCRVADDTAGQPAVSLRMDPAQFLKLATSNANPMASFVTGKLSVRGDILLAARIPSMFAIPRG